MPNVAPMPHPSGDNTGDSLQTVLSDTIRAKREAMNAIREDFATLREMESKANEDSAIAQSELESFARRPVMLSASAIAGGVMGKDEITEALISTYGRAPDTASGKPSKSPSKEGQYYRKRIVTLSEAFEIADGLKPDPETWPKWAQGKDSEDIAQTVAELREDAIAPFTAYATLTKKEKRETGPLAFDAAKITKLAEAVAKDAERIGELPELRKAYAKLVEAIALMG